MSSVLTLTLALVRAAKMNMVMNNDGAGGLFQASSLENPISVVTLVAQRLMSPLVP